MLHELDHFRDADFPREDFQLVDEVPAEPFDIRMDEVLSL